MKYFYSVSQDRAVETKIKRSRFIAHLRYVSTMPEAKEFISEISAQHKTANHNCWAYIVGEKGQTFHSSDDGEPSGTAGQPMLNALKKHDMINVAVVVTRYFGGVKLGIRGLIEAYGDSVEQAIEAEKLLKLVKKISYIIETSYAFAEIFKYNAEKMQAEITNSEYSDVIKVEFSIEEHLNEDLENYINELSASKKIKVL